MGAATGSSQSGASRPRRGCSTKRAARSAAKSSAQMARRSDQKRSVKYSATTGGDQRSRWPLKFSDRNRTIAASMPGRARRTVSRAVSSSGSKLGGKDAPLLRPVVHGGALEAALGVLVPAADHERDHRV